MSDFILTTFLSFIYFMFYKIIFTTKFFSEVILRATDKKSDNVKLEKIKVSCQQEIHTNEFVPPFFEVLLLYQGSVCT